MWRRWLSWQGKLAGPEFNPQNHVEQPGAVVCDWSSTEVKTGPWVSLTEGASTRPARNPVNKIRYTAPRGATAWLPHTGIYACATYTHIPRGVDKAEETRRMEMLF